MNPFFEPWPEETRIAAAFFGKSAGASDIELWLGSSVTAVSLRQVHGNQVLEVQRAPQGSLIFCDSTGRAANEADSIITATEGDALITTLPGIALKIFTADCLPLLAFDGPVIGACHAGWRGLSAGIVENWLGVLGRLGANKQNVRVAVGPAIGPCHFEVGKDVSGQILAGVPVKFLDVFRKPHPDPAKDFIDLKELARFKLRSLGILEENITLSPHCTFCQPKSLPSYRREGKGAGRIQAVIVNSPG